jgi:C1A family cysteine protease
MENRFKQYKLNVRKSPIDTRDWKASAIYPKITLPEILDYRIEMQPIRDQGNQGSCVAMAGAAMKEWQEWQDDFLEEWMSPQFIYNNREDTNEEGMYMRDLMRILKDMGDCKEKTFPYGALSKPSEKVYLEALNYVIKNYASVESIDELKTALYINGPIVIAVPVYNFSERMWYQNPGDELLGGHSMCICGYNTNGFIIRNSWNIDWGQDGYCILPYEDFGLVWEYWTTIDEDSYKPEPEPDNKTWLQKYWWIILLGGITLVTLGIIFL